MRERDGTGPAPGAGGKGQRTVLRVGEDQTSRRTTGWSLPALLRVSSFSSVLPTSILTLSAPLFFSLLGVVGLAPTRSRSRPPVLLAPILFIFPRSCSSTMWFDDLRSLRSSCACYHTAGPCNASRNCSRKVASPVRPTGQLAVLE